MNRTNLFLTCHKDQTQELEINMLLFKILRFILRGKTTKQCKNYKLKVISAIRKDEFELPEGSYSFSSIRDYVEYIIKKHETLTTISPIHIYINRVNNRLVFKT